MPKFRGVGNLCPQPKLDTLVRGQPKCICVWPDVDPKCSAQFDVNSEPVKVIKITEEGRAALKRMIEEIEATKIALLPRATLVKLPRFGLLARSKRSYGEWRHKRLERRKAKRAKELQMLKELEHSSESVLRPFWQVLYAVGTFLSGTRD